MGSVLGSIAGSAANFGLSRLFGGKQQSANQLFTPAPLPGIDAGGFRGTGGSISITPERQGLTAQIGEQFLTEADAIQRLGGEGVEGLRSLRLREADDARTRAIGNLRENLARRRVLGSSFGQDAVSRLEVEAGRERERIQAESALQSLALKERESERRRSAVQAQLEDLNTAADIGLKLSTTANAQLRENAQIIAQLNARGAAGAGQFAGQLAAPISRSIGQAAGGFFGGFGGAPGRSSIGPFTTTVIPG